jgi:hypothetical protein
MGAIAVLIVFKKNSITEGLSILKDRGFNRGFIKALPMAFAVVLFIIVVLNLFTGFYLKFSTSLGNTNPIHKTVLLYNIARDIKSGETVAKTYEEVSAQALSVSTGSRGGNRGKIKTYVLVCDNEDRFMLSSSDASDFERENCRHESGKVEIEYYKNSHIIKSYRFLGRVYDSDIRSQEDVDQSYPKVVIKMDGTELYRPQNMEDYGEIAWVIKRDGELVSPAERGFAPYSVLATYYTHTNIEYDIRENGNYEIYLAKLIRKADARGLYRDYSVYKISNTITFKVD